jgi:SNF2 family DNA or RNA helicase
MLATIVKGRIRLTFPEEVSNEEIEGVLERLAEKIGSARFVDKHPRELSCALSHHNLRKLRIFGVDLSEEAVTRKIVKNMRSKLDNYLVESERVAKVKGGDELYTGYEFKQPPYDHQKLAFQFLHALPQAALFGDCGIGKTFITVTYADSLIKAGVDVAFIVICPVNLIQHVWIEDSAKFSDLRCVGLRESSSVSVLASDYDDKKSAKLGRADLAKQRAERREDPKLRATAKRRAGIRFRKKLDERFSVDADMYVINPEQLRTDPKERRVLKLCKRLIAEGKEICLIIDESSKVKTRTSRTYKSIMRIRAHCSNCIIMTGTPSPNGILDLWAQFSILDGGLTLQPNYVDYRRDFAKEKILHGTTYTDGEGKKQNVIVWGPRAGAAMEVHQLIEPRMIRFKTEDCIDLPPQRFIMRYVDMTADQATFYSDMEDRLFAEIEGVGVTARVAVAKLMKLREVTGGFVMDDTGKPIPFGKNATKMLELDGLLEQTIADKLGDVGPPKKALIWAQYKWECKTLVERYSKNYGAQGLFGGISSGAKDKAIHDFKNKDSCRILVCHPASAGHGLTLTEANFAFYYSLSYNFEEFYQSYRRNRRAGQKRATTYFFLVVPNTIDEELIDAIRSKKNLSDIVTDGEFERGKFLDTRGTLGNQLQLDWATE